MLSKMPRLRLLSLLAALTLALGAAACGDSDDDGGNGGAGDTGTTDGAGDTADGASDTADAGSDRQRVKAAVDDLYAAMRDMDAAGVCAQLNDAAREQIAKGGLSGEETGTCEDGFESFFEQSEQAGGLDAPLDAEVRKVELDGNRATATVNFGPGRNGEVPLVKVDGEWKLEAAGAAP